MKEDTLTSLAAILVLGVGAQWLAWRFRLPAILLLLGCGILAGPVTGFLNPGALLGDLLLPVISGSVAIILFEGGLRLRRADLTEIGAPLRNLVTIGVLVTWVVSAVAAHFILGLGTGMAALFGAILVVSGPTVIGPILRHVRLSGKLGPVLRWESILIDPIGAILAVLVFEAISSGEFQQATTRAVFLFLKVILTGAGVGAAGALLMILMLRRYWIPDYLQNAASLAMVVGTFTASNVLRPDSGLLAVVVMGILIANQRWVSVKHIMDFKENLSVLLIATLFIIIAAQLRLQDFASLGFRSLVFLAVLMLIARPLSVLLSTWRTGLNGRERLYLAWMAPRGIVAASITPIFALRLAHAGYHQAAQLVPFTFMVVIGTVIVYGLSAAPLAHRLKLASPNPQGVLFVGAQPWAQEMARAIQALGYPVLLVDTNWNNITGARMAGLPAYHGSILAEQVTDSINLEGIGRILALTSNDEVNSLSALHFAELFGRSEVYQLPLHHAASNPRQAVAEHLRGRLLFGHGLTYSALDEQFRNGARIKAANLTLEFDYKAFRARYKRSAIPLFLVSESTGLVICTEEQSPTPRAGQCLISLIPDLVEIQD